MLIANYSTRSRRPGFRVRSPDVRLLLIFIAATLFAAGGASAQPARGQAVSSSNFITPFPAGSAYKLTVFGDSFADGLLPSVRAIIGTTQQIEVTASVTKLPPLISAEWDRSVSLIEGLGERDVPEIAIIMMGAYARASIRTAGARRTPLGTDAWRAAYNERLQRLLSALRSKKIAVYWVGQPIVPGAKRAEHSRLLNDIVREREVPDRIRYVDVFDAFADESGGYSAYGPDLIGKVRRMRWKDDLHFSRAGYDRIAHSIGQLIRVDTNKAKSERTVELAGDELAIKQIKARIERRQPSERQTSWQTYLSPFVSSRDAGSETTDNGQTSRELGLPDQTSRVTARIKDAGDLQIVIERPPIPADIVSMVAKTDGRRGDAISGQKIELPTEDGFYAVAVITPAGRNTGAPVRIAQVSTQTPMFRVWHRGERLPPKSNRADDASWPRPMPVVLIPEPQVARTGQAVSREMDPLVAFERARTNVRIGPPLPLRNPRATD